MSEIRIGQGYDVHRLAEGRRLVLGGVTVPHTRGLLGHSDADALTHAVIDALLGAAGLGDIGGMFPDTEEQWRGADSLALLRTVCGRMPEYEIVNVDTTVVAQGPKLAPYREEMRRNLAGAMGVPPERVNVKFTTEEGLGFTGAAQGIAASAAALIRVKG
ncbi:MAG: 2-C-methyl-D-erythritol 2,4-cyclodiphosphate synthase [Oscillospiraceae bacterium]|nr:2-C-methyl-D-erythritol 2,4-cyclodiphosphate synthase [Oscillospiraceae bacterium]